LRQQLQTGGFLGEETQLHLASGRREGWGWGGVFAEGHKNGAEPDTPLGGRPLEAAIS
jgi:hypothetical protein